MTSDSDKHVTLVEAATGRTICQAKPGEITTAMCLSNNMRHLITTSDTGKIFIWRLPENVSNKIKMFAEADKLGGYPMTWEENDGDVS